MRILAWSIGWLVVFWLPTSVAWCQTSPVSDAMAAGIASLSDPGHRWALTMDASKGVFHLGLDSEGTGREQTNLLLEPLRLAWPDAGPAPMAWHVSKDNVWIGLLVANHGGTIRWTIERDRDDLVWRLAYEGKDEAAGLSLTLPLNSLITPTAALPATIDAQGRGAGPWLLVAPDFGHLLVESEPAGAWVVVQSGSRANGGPNAPMEGVDPRLRGQAWIDAVQDPHYRPGRLDVQFVSTKPLKAGMPLTLRFRPTELSCPEGIDAGAWKPIRRAYLNQWQPCGAWAGPEASWVLANNVLSDPASISLWFYAYPMLFCHRPAPGIDVQTLLRHSLDYWLRRHVSAQGHVNAFGQMYDLYPSTGASLIVSAWDYWRISGDTPWIVERIDVLHRMADYLQRRDIDKDGLIESYGSGNAGTLRDPDRADIWFEMMNFGHKNAWANALEYRALLCMAEMLDATGHPKGGDYYRGIAAKLREAYVRQFLSPKTGWFVSWISQDGQVHDYCHTFVNGIAVAYGIVPPDEGKRILSRVVEKSKSIGFTAWHLGVPGNLIPCRRDDLILPRINLDGEPNNTFDSVGFWPEGFTDEKAFGHRYPNGTIHPTLVWYYLLGLQVAGLNEESDRILDAMVKSAQEGLFQNGIVNKGFGGAEHFYIDGRTCGYEGYLPESYNFLMGEFTRNPAARAKLLRVFDLPATKK